MEFKQKQFEYLGQVYSLFDLVKSDICMIEKGVVQVNPSQVATIAGTPKADCVELIALWLVAQICLGVKVENLTNEMIKLVG